MKPQFAPSLMCMDLLNIEKQIRVLNGRMDLYHVDIMDGHYCRNITLSPPIANAAAKLAQCPLDVHLMVTEPNDIIPLLHLRPGDYISVHAETVNTSAFRTLDTIRKQGCRTGIVLNPATNLDAVRTYLDRVDLLTIMTVDVGFAGQPFIVEMLDKIRHARALRAEKDYHYKTQIDGSCNQRTYGRLWEAGAVIFVVGNSALFGLNPDIELACEMMKRQFTEETGVVL